MNNYTTQMDAARQGIITPEMTMVAQKEGLDAETVRQRVAKGVVAIPANKKHVNLSAEGVGEGLRTKINVNLGISEDCADIPRELAKAKAAIALKAEAIMDLSNFGQTAAFRQELVAMSPAMIGTVPIYDAVGATGKKMLELTAEDFLGVVEKHAQDGVDFVTIHAGLTKEVAESILRNRRLTNVVSRGGSLLFAWMDHNGKENPFYEHFDELLEICARYDVTLSLGDSCRPGSLKDASDASQIRELVVLGELTKRAWKKNVQVIVEGPGHMALNEIAANMILQKRLCHGAPFYILGPLVTDVAPGYDHITGAIGGAVAAAAGADFLCYVTPAEHLRLPDLNDMKEGIIASRIAAHAADIAKGLPGARDWDDAMSAARQKVDWEEMFQLAMDPEKARAYRASSQPLHEDTCTMCGDMCALKTMNRILANRPQED